jgi:hypothetical protein
MPGHGRDDHPHCALDDVFPSNCVALHGRHTGRSVCWQAVIASMIGCACRDAANSTANWPCSLDARGASVGSWTPIHPITSPVGRGDDVRRDDGCRTTHQCRPLDAM